MRKATSIGIVFLAALAAGGASADPTPTEGAYCVAALKARAEPLAQRIKSGDSTVDVQLLPIVTASFSFIGSAYKQGLRGPEADKLLAEATRAQSHLPPAELAEVQDRCQAQGQKLYDNANYFERQFVSAAVRARINRLRPQQ
jgi:hypothetical protein